MLFLSKKNEIFCIFNIFSKNILKNKKIKFIHLDIESDCLAMLNYTKTLQYFSQIF